jgi:hypothetical protein
MSRGNLLVAHTTIELPNGVEVFASWFFHPGSEPNRSLQNPDPGSAPELEHVEVDGMIVNGNRDCEYQLRAVIGDTAFHDAEERAKEVAERFDSAKEE